MQPVLSLCLVVKNEALLLGQCIGSLNKIVDEIVIADTGSTDNTVKIAKSFGANVISYRWNGSLGRAKNTCLRHATGKWILFLDGDEKIAEKDILRLRRLLCQKSNVSAYYLPIRNYTKTYNLLWQWFPNNGKYPEEEKTSQCPGWFQTEVIRLFRNREEIRYEEGYSGHVSPLVSLQKHKALIHTADVVIHHFEYLKGGDKFVEEKQRRWFKSELKHTKIFQRDFLTFLNIGKTLFSRKKDRQAIIYLKKAAQLNPTNDYIYFVIGLVFKEMGDYKNAVLNLKQAIKLNPQGADAWTVLGMIYHLCQKLRAAEEALKKAIQIRPLHPLAHNSLGIVYQDQFRYREAEREYQEAIRIHPEHPDAHHNLNLLYECQQK